MASQGDERIGKADRDDDVTHDRSRKEVAPRQDGMRQVGEKEQRDGGPHR
jgi:hypothetical protein